MAVCSPYIVMNIKGPEFGGSLMLSGSEHEPVVRKHMLSLCIADMCTRFSDIFAVVAMQLAVACQVA